MKKLIPLFFLVFAFSTFGQKKPITKPKSKPIPVKISEKTNSTIPLVKKPEINKCNLTTKDAPALRGVRLGMTPEEVSKVLKYPIVPSESGTYARYLEVDPLTKKETVISGQVNVGDFSVYLPIKEEQLNANPDLKGVEVFFGSFFNNKLYSMLMKYDEKLYNFGSLEKFISTVSVTINIPQEIWLITEYPTRRNAIADCQNFYVSASSGKVYKKTGETNETFDLSIVDNVISFELNKKADEIFKKKTEEEAKRKAAENVFKP